MFLAEIISGDAALGGVVGIVVTALAAGVAKLMLTRHQISQEERKDLRDEWKELANRQQVQLDAQQVRIISLEKDKEECRKENAQLRTDVAVLRMEVGRSGKAAS